MFIYKLIIFVNNNVGVIFKAKQIERVSDMKKDTYSNGEPTIAEGINTEDELNKDATPADIEKGESTNVTVLSLDENDPS